MSFDEGSKILVKVIQDLSLARRLEEVTALVRTAARKIAQADGATFVLRDGEMCSYIDEEAITPLWKGQKFPLTACVSGWAMLNKQQTVIEDIYKDSRVPIDAYRPTFVKSLAMTPMRRNSPIGAIGTYWQKIHRPSLEQQELLQALADSASVAMENLNLYANLNSHIEELRKSNQAKDEFLMTVSHELRTPLNAILGWADILTQGQADAEDLHTGLETILRNAQHQLKIVEDLLDSSRILVGRVLLDRRAVDLCQIVAQSVVGFKNELQKKQMQLEVKSHLSSATIKADMVRVRQIVDNIIMNAIKFSFAGGRIHVLLEKKGPQVEFVVQDQGEGIRPEFLPQIFERLQQADSSTTRRHGGLGLGLSIAKHLTEAFDGHITAESEGLGTGATFRISFPLQEFELKKEVVAVQNELSKHALRGVRILVIDDDNDARKVVERVLQKYGAEVNGVDSVSAALKVNQSNYEVIVCDLSMPEEDGFSLVNKIRHGRTQFDANTPTMALTAFNDQASKQKALDGGFDKFMGKPFSVPSLIHSVAELRETLH